MIAQIIAVALLVAAALAALIIASRRPSKAEAVLRQMDLNELEAMLKLRWTFTR